MVEKIEFKPREEQRVIAFKAPSAFRESLDLLAKKHNTSMSEIVREVVTEWMKKEERGK